MVCEHNMREKRATPRELELAEELPACEEVMGRFVVRALLACTVFASAAGQEIVNCSVNALQKDWDAAPRYSFTERDEEVKGDSRSIKTYRVLMIEGSPYKRLVAVDDQPLPATQDAREERQLSHEIERRRKEAPDERARRLAKYDRERNQDQALLREMTEAFDFSFAGEETVSGHGARVFAAQPRPGFRPHSRETTVLTGMRGRLWIEERECQWVKAEAEVFRPVTFGLFIAKVSPGTQFLLEQGPVSSGIWLPRHFRVELKESVLGASRHTIDDETYSDYRISDPVDSGRK
jgi:hypothetical protein